MAFSAIVRKLANQKQQIADLKAELKQERENEKEIQKLKSSLLGAVNEQTINKRRNHEMFRGWMSGEYLFITFFHFEWLLFWRKACEGFAFCYWLSFCENSCSIFFFEILQWFWLWQNKYRKCSYRKSSQTSSCCQKWCLFFIWNGSYEVVKQKLSDFEQISWLPHTFAFSDLQRHAIQMTWKKISSWYSK